MREEEEEMEKPNGDSSPQVVSKSRLEFLFDGIFAIAMTILVLDLKVPELADRHSITELWKHLAQHVGTFFSYFFSFGMLGVLWYSHNRQFRHLQHVTPKIVFFLLLQLSMAAFFPFCAGTFGHYPTNYLAMTLYSGCILVYMACTATVWFVARRSGALEPELSNSNYRQFLRRNLRGLSVISVFFLFYFIMAIANCKS
jgi:uncharacterized membrane protein